MIETATFGAGCFWGVEAAFRKVPGVVNATAGFMGGSLEDPSYEDVVTRDTGHAEVVRIEYDPEKVRYEQLLQLFWFIHDPTQVNRQGNDVGTQYRSVIFTHTPEQAQLAQASFDAVAASGQYRRPLTTTIEPADTFYPAEEYHQQYLEKNPGGYCHVNLGKVEDFLQADSSSLAE